MDYSRFELAEHLAAGYVAGTLRGRARQRFENLMPAHPALRASVRDWQARLMPLTGSVTPVTPSPAVWKRIEARLDGHAAPAARVAAAAGASWWSGLAFWRGFAALATVASLTLAVLLASPPPAQVPMVVVLNATAPIPGVAQGVVPATFVASISGDGRAMVTRPLTPVSLQADRALELWAVPADGPARSLGVISADGATVVRREQLLRDTAALAVTVEPPGGSPTGKATGPIVYLGKLTL